MPVWDGCVCMCGGGVFLAQVQTRCPVVGCESGPLYCSLLHAGSVHVDYMYTASSIDLHAASGLISLGCIHPICLGAKPSIRFTGSTTSTGIIFAVQDFHIAHHFSRYNKCIKTTTDVQTFVKCLLTSATTNVSENSTLELSFGRENSSLLLHCLVAA